MITSMDTDFTEEEVVENPTLKAAYNLAPLHQNQPLRWDYEVDLIGQKVFDKILHLCEICEMPILVYGRLLPCKHVFCFLCARKCEATCKRCSGKIQKVEELALSTVYVCTFGAPKHCTTGCRRTYLSQRDLQSHIAHRHLAKSSSSESKSSSSSVPQPQLPLTQQQAAAQQQQQHVVSQTATATPTSQPTLLSSMHNQQVLTTSSYAHPQQQHHHLHHQLHDVSHQQRLNPAVPGMGSTSVSPALSQASPDLKSTSMMSHGMAYNASLQTTDQQGIYRPVDSTSLPLHQFQQQSSLHTGHQSLHQQQQQQPPPPHHQQQQHLQVPLSQQQQQQQHSAQMRHSSSPGMPAMSKPMARFTQSLQNPMSSSMQGSHVNPYQATSSGSPSDMQLSTQMHHQQPRQNINLHHSQQQQQQHQQQMIPPQRLMPKNYNDMQSDMDGYERLLPKMDGYGNPRQMPNVDDNDNMQGNGMQNLDNFNSIRQQGKLFNPLQDVDDRERVFNPHQPSMMDSSNSGPPGPQGGGQQASRNKNVNLITVPIQDEGHYRPMPYVNQSQHPSGVGPNKNFAPSSYSSNMSPSVSSNPSQQNFSSGLTSQSMSGSGGGVRPSHRMPFNRPINSLSQQKDSPQGGVNTNPMLSNPRGMGGGGGGSARLTLGTNMPPNVQGALAGAVQALTRNVTPQHNPRFSAPPSQAGHWSGSGGGGGGSTGAGGSGNLRPIQPRMTQNMPGRVAKAEGQFNQQGYYR